MRMSACSILAALFALTPAVAYGMNICHCSLARSGVCLSQSSGKQILSTLGWTFSSEAVGRQPAGSGGAISDPRGSEAANAIGTGAELIGIRLISPNPFSPTTTIAYAVGEQTHVSLRIYDASGRLVRTLVDETKAAGQVHTVAWSGTNDLGEVVPSGIYFCQLVTGKLVQTRKIVLLN